MKFFLYLLLFTLSFSQNFSYNEEDWFTISNPGVITSITTARDEIIFSSENGIFIYDKYSLDLFFLEDYVRNFNYKNCYIAHYDDSRDYLWLLNEDNLAYKPYSSTFWREIDFYELNLSGHRNILNIGSNVDYVFINLGSEILVLNPYTGQLIEDEINDYNNIKWTSSYRNLLSDNYDLTNFHSFDGYHFMSNQLIQYNGMDINISSIARDGSSIWVGTDSGEIFLCDLYLRTVEKINSMPLFSNINRTYLDDNAEWWISTNDLVFLNDKIFMGNNQIFLVRWIEKENQWVSYHQNKYSNIHSGDITSMLRINEVLYIGTRFGLLIFDINNEKWNLINKENDLYGEYIYDLDFFEKNLYIATSLGLSVLSVEDDYIFQNKFQDLKNHTIYDILINKDSLFLISEIGLLEYNLSTNQGIVLINEKFNQLLLDENEDLILSKRNRIYKYSNRNKELMLGINKIQNLSYCDNHIWINHGKTSSLYDISNQEVFEYNSNDGISGSKINYLDCDESWVWFSTNKGISFYNWSQYHSREK